MKKHLFKSLSLAALGMMLAGTASAQEAVNVEKTDGGLLSTRLAELKKITFSADETEMTLHTTDGGQAVFTLADVKRITFGAYTEVATGLAAPRTTRFSLTLGGTLCVAAPDGIRSVSLYDVRGTRLYTRTFTDAPTEADVPVSAFRKGLCLVRVQTGAATVTQKITVK